VGAKRKKGRRKTSEEMDTSVIKVRSWNKSRDLIHDDGDNDDNDDDDDNDKDSDGLIMTKGNLLISNVMHI
jgi:hypothetical protein